MLQIIPQGLGYFIDSIRDNPALVFVGRPYMLRAIYPRLRCNMLRTPHRAKRGGAFPYKSGEET
jgi:hypothetical protein